MDIHGSYRTLQRSLISCRNPTDFSTGCIECFANNICPSRLEARSSKERKHYRAFAGDSDPSVVLGRSAPARFCGIQVLM